MNPSAAPKAANRLAAPEPPCCPLSIAAIKPPPTNIKMPSKAHRPPNTNHKTEITVTPVGLPTRSPSFICVSGRIVGTLFPLRDGKLHRWMVLRYVSEGCPVDLQG